MLKSRSRLKCLKTLSTGCQLRRTVAAKIRRFPSRRFSSHASCSATQADIDSAVDGTSEGKTEANACGNGEESKKRHIYSMDKHSTSSQTESLNVLEWPSVCRQVRLVTLLGDLVTLLGQSCMPHFLVLFFPQLSHNTNWDRTFQVACFCGTIMATELVVAGGLPMGRTQDDSERLLRQTTEALEANLRQVHLY